MRYFPAILGLILLIGYLAATACSSGVPPVISYEGRLTNESGAPVPDDTYSMRFAIYDQPAGGKLLWQEPASGTMPVPTLGGRFMVFLGAAVPLTPDAFPGGTFLQTEVNGQVMSPRSPIVSSAYTIRAMLAESVEPGSVNTESLENESVTNPKLAPNSVTGDKILNGAIGINKVSTEGANLGDVLTFNGIGLDWVSPLSALVIGPGLEMTGTGPMTLRVVFAGSGSAATVSRSDHNHDSSYSAAAHTHSATEITSGILDDARLSSNIARLSGANIWLGANTFTAGSPSTKPLIVKAAAGQTANLQEWQSDTGTVLTQISPTGVISGNGSGLVNLSAGNLNGTINDLRLSTNIPRLNANNNWTGSNTFQAPTLMNSGQPSYVGLTVQGLASQTGDLQQWRTSTGAMNARVNAGGFFAGDGTYLLGVNAINSDKLDNIDSSEFSRTNHHHDSAYWKLGGNGGTAPGTNFVGTLDAQPLEFRVNNMRAVRIEPNGTSPNLIAGHPNNNITSGVVGANIGGGGSSVTGYNRVTDEYGTISGGTSNRAGNDMGPVTDASLSPR